MYNRISIINVPLLACIIASIAIHVGALYCKGIYSPPVPSMEQGRTVVHLTLVPSLSSQAAAQEQEPQPEEPLEQLVALQMEQSLRSTPSAAPVVAVLAEPLPSPQSIAETESINSLDQDASLLEEMGVTAEAHPFKAVEPAYPRISRRRGEEGTITLSIEVMQNGRAGKISILQSSGHRRLDEAALTAVQQTTFTPAKQFGRNIDSTTELSFTFTLTDD